MSIWNSQWEVDCIGCDYETVIPKGIDLATATSWNNLIRILIPMENPDLGFNEALVTAEQAADLISALMLAINFIDDDNKKWGRK